jgi:sec-independent protein translocase protein TatB
MFDIGWGELLVIGIVALVVIGPKELPGVLRTLGQAMNKVRRMASEFQGQFQEAMREAEMQDIKKSVDELTSSARDFSSYDPLADKPKPATQPTSSETAAPASQVEAPPLSAPAETPALPAAETPALPAAETPALPEPDLGPIETHKPGEGRSS